jgi:hypothetical protein
MMNHQLDGGIEGIVSQPISFPKVHISGSHRENWSDGFDDNHDAHLGAVASTQRRGSRRRRRNPAYLLCLQRFCDHWPSYSFL